MTTSVHPASAQNGVQAVDPAELTVVPRRHPGRWVSGAVVIVIGLLLLRSVVGNERFQWDVVGLYLRDVSIAVGLLAVGHGLDKNSTP